jgi:hypothetical protein
LASAFGFAPAHASEDNANPSTNVDASRGAEEPRTTVVDEIRALRAQLDAIERRLSSSGQPPLPPRYLTSGGDIWRLVAPESGPTALCQVGVAELQADIEAVSRSGLARTVARFKARRSQLL